MSACSLCGSDVGSDRVCGVCGEPQGGSAERASSREASSGTASESSGSGARVSLVTSASAGGRPAWLIPAIALFVVALGVFGLSRVLGSDGEESVAAGEISSSGSSQSLSPTEEAASADPAESSSSPAPSDLASTAGAVGSPPSDSATSGDGRIPESGVYFGEGYQRDLNGTRLDKSYALEMTFSSAGSSIRYPGINCSGNLVPDGFSEGARVYREQITVGSCDQGGTWSVLVRSSSDLTATYRPPSGKYTVVGDLTR